MAMISNGLSEAAKRIAAAGYAYQARKSAAPPAPPPPVFDDVKLPELQRVPAEVRWERSQRLEALAIKRRTILVREALERPVAPGPEGELGRVSLFPRRPSSQQIILDALAIFGLTKEEFFSERRKRLFVVARHYAAQRIIDEVGASYPRCAKILGKEDHTTMIHACGDVQRARVAAWLAGKGAT